jgi:predicted  nucleic acid-binding Zn-ribbon protein
MKRTLVLVASLLLAGAVAPLVRAQNNPQPTHVITEEDIQRYHQDHPNDTTTSTTDQTTNTQTDATTTTGNNVDDLKAQLDEKQKEMKAVKGQRVALDEFISSTKKDLETATDDDYKASLQNRLDGYDNDLKDNEAKRTQLEKDISDLQQQITDAENAQNNEGGTTTTTTETNQTETTNQTESNNTSTQNTNPPNNSSANPPQL